MAITYRAGYSTAEFLPDTMMVRVTHSVFSSNREIATAAREVNYLAGNWGKTRLTNRQSLNPVRGKLVTFYFVDPA